VKIWKGKAEGIIDSTEKSLGRLTNALGDIVFPADADVEPKEEPKETPEDGKKK
jgi:hypothetical protein